MSKVTVATHNGSFHLDDLFAVSLVCLLNPQDDCEIIRTRQQEVIDGANWVVDVGGVYDHNLRRYDHHQPNGPVRENGIPYAAFGLVWRHWGMQLCRDQSLVELIDCEFIQMLDGPDNGYQTYQSLIEGAAVPALSMLPSLWRPSWDDDNIDNDDAFFELLPFVKTILVKLIETYQSRAKANFLFDNEYKNSDNKKLIEVPAGVFPGNVEDYPETKFIISQDPENKNWKAKCISEGSFNCRVSFPLDWRGLSGEELQMVSKIKSAEFVHPAGFLAVAKNREDIYKMCRLALGQVAD